MSSSQQPNESVSRAGNAARLAVRTGRLAGLAAVRLRNQVQGPRFRRQAGTNGRIPRAAVAVFFATGPDNLYQFAQWRRPLERLARQRPVFVVVDRPDTGSAILATSTLPVAFARGSAELEELVAEHDVRVVLYLNQVAANFAMLRFPGPVHVQIGHGESDKAGSVSNQHKAYDLTFVGGPAGRERLARTLRGFDADQRTREVGRPQLDVDYPGAPEWPRDSGLRVWYAPTWEGDRPSIAYGSLVTHGLAIVATLLSDPGVRVIYRPHPRTGRSSAAYGTADAAVRALLAAQPGRHLVDTGDYGWQWRFADACVTDVSAVAYDWLATGKPLVITQPTPTAWLPPAPLFAQLPLLPAARSPEVLSWLRDRGLGDPTSPTGDRLRRLAQDYFGDTANGASSRRFAAAVEDAYALAAR